MSGNDPPPPILCPCLSGFRSPRHTWKTPYRNAIRFAAASEQSGRLARVRLARRGKHGCPGVETGVAGSSHATRAFRQLSANWFRLAGSNDRDPLGNFAERVAKASTMGEIRSALVEAARRLGALGVPEDGTMGSHPVLTIPLRFGGRHVGSLRLAIDRRRWTDRQRQQLEALAALAAAAELARSARPAGWATFRRRIPCDSVTGLPTAAFLDAHLAQALALTKRRKESLTLLAVSIDGLDRLRDRDGPEFAGMALGLAARAVAGTLRASDLVVRLDGDRLVAVLPGAGKTDAIRVGEVIRRAVAEAGIASSVPTTLTASIGIATFPDDAHTPRGLLTACEQALQEGAKSNRHSRSSRSGLDTGGSPR